MTHIFQPVSMIKIQRAGRGSFGRKRKLLDAGRHRLEEHDAEGDVLENMVATGG